MYEYRRRSTDRSIIKSVSLGSIDAGIQLCRLVYSICILNVITTLLACTSKHDNQGCQRPMARQPQLGRAQAEHEKLIPEVMRWITSCRHGLEQERIEGTFDNADNATVRRKTSDFPCLGGNALGKVEVLQDRGHKLVGRKGTQVLQVACSSPSTTWAIMA